MDKPMFFRVECYAPMETFDKLIDVLVAGAVKHRLDGPYVEKGDLFIPVFAPAKYPNE